MAAYTFENVRLLFLSGDDRHPSGLGNATGQPGKHFMSKMFPHVDGYFPDTVFNRHAGPAAQAVVIDDFLDASFDCGAHGFLGGATLGAENQFLPIQISRETLPPDVPRWGKRYKEHLRDWQHWSVVRMQPEALSYQSNYLDIDPHHRDRGGLGMPVIRVTYDLQPNEQRLADFMARQGEEILRAMGATRPGMARDSPEPEARTTWAGAAWATIPRERRRPHASGPRHARAVCLFRGRLSDVRRRQSDADPGRSVSRPARELIERLQRGDEP